MAASTEKESIESRKFVISGFPPILSGEWKLFLIRSTIKVNLHWGVARSSRARFFVCFVASGNSALVHDTATPGRNKTNKESWAATPGNSSVQIGV